MSPLTPRRKRYLFAALFFTVMTAAPLVLSAAAGSSYPTIANVMILIGINAIAALGLNIMVGYCGLLNLGFAGFMLIGAYTSGILMKEYDFSFLSAVVVSVAHGAVWGIVLGIPTLRLTGDYFAIVTFGFSELVIMVARNWVAITRGPRGYPGVPRPAFDFNWLHSLGIGQGRNLRFEFTIGDQTCYIWLIAFLLGLCLVVSDRVRRSRLGRAWRALREDEVAAEACGINAMWYKTIAFAISAGYGALAGTLMATYSSLVDCRYFEFMTSVFVLCYLVLGGMGTVIGPAVGAAVLVSTGELLRGNPAGYLAPLVWWWPGAKEWLQSLPWVPDMRLILYGIILVLVIRFRPEGLIPSRTHSREFRHRSDTGEPEESSLWSLRSQ